MNKYDIKIEWNGPFNLQTVISEMNNAGTSPLWEGEDYGLYQIYGRYILCGSDTLLYIGETTEQTFSVRLNQHKIEWLDKEENIQIYIGKVCDSMRYSRDDKWESWKKDIKLAERILIYKYSPPYNSAGISSEAPTFPGKLIHSGKKHKLEAEDKPQDWENSSGRGSGLAM